MKSRPVLLGFVLGTLIIGMLFGVAALVMAVIPEDSGFRIGGGDIAVIDIRDQIVESRYVLEEIDRYREDNSVKAVLVRIDSPGGAVGPSQEIYAELLKLRQEKVVVASLGSMAASGGYYIAAAAQTIVANPGTLTGSIGAIMEFMNLEDLYRWAHIQYVTVKSGDFKDMGSSARPLRAEEKALLQAMVDNVLSQFVRAIADGRGLPLEQVRAIADGRIFTGEQALALGLVDRLGNFNDAVDVTAELAGITGRPHLIRAREKRVDLFELFLDDVAGSLARAFQSAGAAVPAPWTLR